MICLIVDKGIDVTLDYIENLITFMMVPVRYAGKVFGHNLPAYGKRRILKITGAYIKQGILLCGGVKPGKADYSYRDYSSSA